MTPTTTPTKYIVLAKDESGHWRELGEANANNARDAISTRAEDEGTYVAVPYRSWKQVGLIVETVKRKVWDTTNGGTPQPKETP